MGFLAGKDEAAACVKANITLVAASYDVRLDLRTIDIGSINDCLKILQFHSALLFDNQLLLNSVKTDQSKPSKTKFLLIVRIEQYLL